MIFEWCRTRILWSTSSHGKLFAGKKRRYTETDASVYKDRFHRKHFQRDSCFISLWILCNSLCYVPQSILLDVFQKDWWFIKPLNAIKLFMLYAKNMLSSKFLRDLCCIRTLNTLWLLCYVLKIFWHVIVYKTLCIDTKTILIFPI